jgi:pimeloyl-ACP methyl ester carboxylesterase
MNKEADVIERGSSRFRWLERGDGDPVVLLHGLMGEMDHWESTLETLGAFCRPLALELPLFDADLLDVSVPGLADYVRRFMEALELRPAVIGGRAPPTCGRRWKRSSTIRRS